MTKTARARYTLEFKQEAVRLVEGGQSIAAAARTLGVADQTLFNWVKAQRQGQLKGADSKAKVSVEQMEISRLRAELARMKIGARHSGKSDGVLRKGIDLKYALSNATVASGRSRCNAAC
jgi:transposase